MRQETQSFRCDIQAFQFLKEEIGIFLIFDFLEFIIFFLHQHDIYPVNK